MSLAALLLAGCGPSGNSFRLKGTITGMESGELYIYNTSFENARFDTLRLEAGSFYYGGIADEVTPYIIVFPNALEQVVFIGPGEEIEYEAVSNDLNKYIVKGSEDNKLMNAFRASIANTSYSDIQAAARKFMAENSKSTVSLYIFESYFLMNPHTTYKELMETLEILRPDNQDNSYFSILEAKAQSLRSLNIGDTFPNLKLPTKDRKTVNLWTSGNTSSYTTFLCWATWISTSYEIIAKMRQYARETSKDKMRFVTFSLDNEYDRWNNMTRTDSVLPLEHYIDTKSFASPAIHDLGTSNIPTYFIIDSNKKIVAKGTEVSTLGTDIEKFTK